MGRDSDGTRGDVASLVWFSRVDQLTPQTGGFKFWEREFARLAAIVGDQKAVVLPLTQSPALVRPRRVAWPGISMPSTSRVVSCQSDWVIS